MPTIKMTSAQFAKKLEQFARVYTQEVIKAETATIEDAKKIAIELSGGPHSSAALAKADHPYSRRRPQRSKYPPQIINKQTGKFQGAWRIVRPRVVGKTIVTRLHNTDPKAKFMAGTKLMIARPIAREIRKRIANRRVRRLKTAYNNTIRRVFPQK